uniref:Uncharacterized protein n=1 Tax=Peronospora matthiolae TaxID=2874970 RepID=A0AAV1UH62_9STRA
MGNAYTIELPRKMLKHPTFYVGRLRSYYQYEIVLEANNTSAVKGRDHLRVVPFQRTSLVD